MKKCLFSFVFLLACGAVYSQTINYVKTFNEGIIKARKEKKLLFVHIDVPPPPPGFRPANVTVNKSIDAPEVVDLYNKSFVNYTVNISDTSSNSLKKRYRLNRFPAYIFIDGRSNLVYQENQYPVVPASYVNMAQKALAEFTSGKTLSDYELKYQPGFVSADFLKEYITKREDMGIFDNSALIDEYVDMQSPKLFQNYKEVLFILKAGPTAESQAYSLCYTNRRITDSIYRYEPSAIRSAINGRIDQNTLAKAIRLKNRDIAQAGANFTQRIYNNSNPLMGERQSQLRMLDYYRGVKDTALLFRVATQYYDTYFMSISADSSRQIDQKRLAANRAGSMVNLKPDTIKTIVGKDTVRRIISKKSSQTNVPFTIAEDGSISSGFGNSTAGALSNAASEFYCTGTRNKAVLTKALSWSRRAIELIALPPYYDTEAHLFYRLAMFDEAIAAEEKAIDLAGNQTKQIIDRYKAELNKIKSHQL